MPLKGPKQQIQKEGIQKKRKKVKQSHYRPRQAQRVVVGCQLYSPAAFTPQEMLLVLISVRD